MTILTRIQKKYRRILYGIGSLMIFFGFWAILSAILQYRQEGDIILPYPNQVIYDFFYLWFHKIDNRTLFHHVFASLLRVFYGFLIALIIGVPTGLILARSIWLKRFIKPIIEMLRPIPPIAWIPFAIILFGLGLFSQGFIIFIGAFFPLFQNTYDGIRNSDQVYQDVARSLGASKSQMIWDVLIPSILPNLITGTRTAIGVGWMSVIAAELLGISANVGGIGYFINYMKNIGNYSYMMAGMLMIAIVGLLIDALFNLTEKYIIPWGEEA